MQRMQYDQLGGPIPPQQVPCSTLQCIYHLQTKGLSKNAARPCGKAIVMHGRSTPGSYPWTRVRSEILRTCAVPAHSNPYARLCTRPGSSYHGARAYAAEVRLPGLQRAAVSAAYRHHCAWWPACLACPAFHLRARAACAWHDSWYSRSSGYTAYANSGYQSMSGSPQPVMQPMTYVPSPQLSYVSGPVPAQAMMAMPMQVRALQLAQPVVPVVPVHLEPG